MNVMFMPHGKHISSKENTNLLQASQKAGMRIPALCGGKGVCGKCRVRILEGDAPPSPTERRHLSRREMDDGVRLACQVAVRDDMRVEILEESRPLEEIILLEGVGRTIPLCPNVQKYHFILDPPSLTDTRSDLTRIMEALGTLRIEEAELGAIRKLPCVMREKNFSATAVIVGGRIADFEVGDTTERKYGIALDIGTTTLAAYLLDLNTGRRLAVSSMINPQTDFGEDVVSRIHHSAKPGGLQRLHAMIIRAINDIAEALCEEAKIEKKNIYEMTFVGNTCMHHLFLGIPPSNLAVSPYVAAVRQPLDIIHPDLPARNVYVLPTVAGFVGADTVGCLLASPPGKKTRLLLDIGTNCEVVLGNSKMILACSAAAGPAFEGAHIKHGMRASPGAIVEVLIEDEIVVRTVGDEPPYGIAGSGLVSATAAMLRSGILTPMGRMVRNHDFSCRMKGEGGNAEFILVEKEGEGKEITITQKDIREVQLAKGAIFAAQRILQKEYGIDHEGVEELELAGAFGTFLPVHDAITIGMIPDLPSKKIRCIGNAAGSGAQMALLSVGERKKAEVISKKIKYVELSGRKDFSEEFICAMEFPHKNPDLFPRMRERLNLD